MLTIHVLAAGDDVIEALVDRGDRLGPEIMIGPEDATMLLQLDIPSDEPLLPYGQQFVQGLEVDVTFDHGPTPIYLTVHKVRSGRGKIEVFFLWRNPGVTPAFMAECGYHQIGPQRLARSAREFF